MFASASDALLAEIAALSASGRFAEAYAKVTTALDANADDFQLWFARGSVLLNWGRPREALAAYLKADAGGLSHATLHSQLASVFGMLGDSVQAEAWARKAVATDPGSANAHLSLANVLQNGKSLAEAVESYERAAAISPEDADCLTSLANCHLARNAFALAERAARRAIACDPARAIAWSNLGVALAGLDRHEEALTALKHAQSLETKQGQDAEIAFNLAVVLHHSGDVEAAIDLYEATLEKHPMPRGFYGYAEALLTAGRLREGFEAYEFRWMKQPQLSQRPRLRQPKWTGQDPRGKRVLLIVEQGFGDTFQFVRFAREVKSLGASVLIRANDALKGLIETAPGIDQALFSDDPLPDFDFWIPLLSLPRVFGLDIDSIPATVPYLRAPPERVETWSKRLGDGSDVKVGVAWSGNPEHARDRYRSIPENLIGTLSEAAGVRLFSLQKAGGKQTRTAMPAGFTDLGPELRDFADTAAMIAKLDLVIAVDTAVAHLAGAMGVPVWLLVPQPAEWRWMQDNEASPWYPTMKIFRQSRRGDWGEVIDRVNAELAATLRSGDFGRRTIGGNDAWQRPSSPRSLPEPGTAARPEFATLAETAAGIVQYLPDGTPAAKSIAWYGEYLQQPIEFMLRYIAAGSVVLEVEAGPGLHTLLIAHAVGPQGRVIAYDSRAPMLAVLKNNADANGLTNITVMNAGMNNGVDELRLDRLDWLKVDSAASVPRVLEGSADTIWRLRPCVLVVDVEDASIDDLACHLRTFGYRCWRMNTTRFNPSNFNRREYDIFAHETTAAVVAIPEETDATLPDGCVELT
jgi:tetratricopeptide (TPR) repeat protein/precorrin-6B methylase 2